MSYFPLCIDLTDATVLLVGNGPQIQEKLEKLHSFQANLLCLDCLTEADLQKDPAMVIIGDLPFSVAQTYSDLCRARNIPVNVVDIPQLCSFYFPALIQRGDLTLGITTGGKSPGFAARLRRKLECHIPQASGDILNWLQALRPQLKARLPQTDFRRILGLLTEESLSLGRPLTEEETETLISREIS